jgi:hypothetical protein
VELGCMSVTVNACSVNITVWYGDTRWKKKNINLIYEKRKEIYNVMPLKQKKKKYL